MTATINAEASELWIIGYLIIVGIHNHAPAPEDGS